MPYTAHRILIVDDDKDIGTILETVLKREGFTQVRVATTAALGTQLFKEWQPHLVLLDIMLPDGSGYDLFAIYKAHSASTGQPMVPVLFISAKDEEVDRLLGFALGADDYITKPFSSKEVAYRVKARLKVTPADLGSRPSDPPKIEPIRFGDIVVNVEAGEVWRAGEHIPMTAKEFKLLLVLVQNPNRVLSKETIGEAVWGEMVWSEDYQGFDNTISVHMRKLRRKIEVDPAKPQWLQTVIGLGYKFVSRNREVNP